MNGVGTDSEYAPDGDAGDDGDLVAYRLTGLDADLEVDGDDGYLILNVVRLCACKDDAELRVELTQQMEANADFEDARGNHDVAAELRRAAAERRERPLEPDEDEVEELTDEEYAASLEASADVESARGNHEVAAPLRHVAAELRAPSAENVRPVTARDVAKVRRVRAARIPQPRLRSARCRESRRSRSLASHRHSGLSPPAKPRPRSSDDPHPEPDLAVRGRCPWRAAG